MKKLKLKKGGDDKPKSKTYTNKAEYDKALQAYSDSLSLSNGTEKALKYLDTNPSMENWVDFVVNDDPVVYKAWKRLNELNKKSPVFDTKSIYLNSSTTGRQEEGSINLYKKPVVKPEYQSLSTPIMNEGERQMELRYKPTTTLAKGTLEQEVRPTMAKDTMESEPKPITELMMPSGSYMQKDDFIKRYGEKPWLKATGQKFNKGGTVMKKLKIKRKGYANGTDSSGVDMGMTPEQLSAYNAAQTQAEKDKIAADAKKLNQIGSAMQAVKIPDVGSGAKSDQYNQSKATADATGATISAGVGAVNPVAGGITNILNEVGTTARESTEKTDEYGVPIKSKESVGTTAALGGLFSPSKALQYRIESGDWTSTSGDKYYDFMFGDAIKAQRQKSVRAAEDDVNYVNRTALKDGGEVKGKGGPKDDAVAMDLPKGSFVVPAENAPIAEQLRKEVLGESTKKAKSKGDVPVKVSDGEHVFTPSERAAMAAQGIDLTKLAPDADDDNNYNTGTPDGGVTKPKKDRANYLIEWEDGTLSYYDGTPKEIMKEHPGAKIIGEHDSIAAQKYNSIFNNGSGKVPTTEKEKKAFQQNLADAGFYDGEIDGKIGAKTVKAAEERAAAQQGVNLQAMPSVGNSSAPFQIIPPTQSATPTPTSPIVNTSQIPASTPAPEKTGLQKAPDAVGGGVGALALGQIAAGLATTISGKRPKGEIDSTYLGQVADALKDQKTGLGATELTKRENDLALIRKSLTRDAVGRTDNAGAAFAMAKEAAGQEAASVIDLAVADARMKLAKKGRADSLASGLASMKRQLFQDDLSAFQQNQAAAAELTQAGISNFVGNKQYRDAQNRMDERLAKYGTVAFNIPTTTTD